MKISQKWQRPSRTFMLSVAFNALCLPCLGGDLMAQGSVPNYTQLPAADRVTFSARAGYDLMRFVVTEDRKPLTETMAEAKAKVKALPVTPS